MPILLAISSLARYGPALNHRMFSGISSGDLNHLQNSYCNHPADNFGWAIATAFRSLTLGNHFRLRLKVKLKALVLFGESSELPASQTENGSLLRQSGLKSRLRPQYYVDEPLR
jgi:hypothetical protein